jgi:hypothetical protein
MQFFRQRLEIEQKTDEDKKEKKKKKKKIVIPFWEDMYMTQLEFKLYIERCRE